tara:strand:- start:236 stop:922 length:687 start_codon:yes stop_codon:yes gene_type:complete
MTKRTENSKLDRNGRGAKKNYNAISYGTAQGRIQMGQIAKKGDVTTGVGLYTPDAEHQLTLDIDGQRKGNTTSIGPGKFEVKCGSDNQEAENSMILTAVNGDISIIAANGKIRLQGTDIELFAVGEGSSKGNITMEATESVISNSKKFLVNAKNLYKIVTPATGQMIANGVLQIYGKTIQGVTDAVVSKEPKNSNAKFWKVANPGAKLKYKKSALRLARENDQALMDQ